MTEFDGQYIEGREVVRRAPRATLDTLLNRLDPQQRLTREEIDAYYAEHPEEAEMPVVYESLAEFSAHLDAVDADALTESLEQMRRGEGEVLVARTPEPTNSIIVHAMEILRTLGPEVTTAYLVNRAGDEEHEHEASADPPL